MTTIRTRLAALENRMGNNAAARLQRRIEAMSNEELKAEIAAYEAANAHLTDNELRAEWKAEGFSDGDIDLVIASRTCRCKEGSQV